MRGEFHRLDRTRLACAIGVAMMAASASAFAQDTTTAGGGRGGAGGGQQAPAAPRPYARVITDEAVTKSGLLKVHKVGANLFFEIPRNELRKDILVMQRMQAGTSGGQANRTIAFEREGNRVLLRSRSYAVRADSSAAIYQAVSAMNLSPIIAAFNVDAYGADSAPVINVTRLFTTNITEFAGVPAVQADRSFIETFSAFPENVNVVATQTGNAPPAAAAQSGWNMMG